MMEGLRYLVLLWTFAASTTAFFIYEPSNNPVEEAKKNTIADYVSKGFAFNGFAREDSAQLLLPKITITKRALPVSSLATFELVLNFLIRSQRRTTQGTPIKRANNWQIETANTPTQTLSAAISEDALDYSYFSSMTFGSKGQSLYMLLDTGSSDTWVMGTGCKSTACGNHNTFGKVNSDTLKVTTTQFSDVYGTGNVSGVIVTDNVQLAGMKVPLTFGLGSTVSDHFANYPMDGLLGLGRPSGSTLNAPTFMQALINAKLLLGNVFGVSLQRHSDGTMDGEINFGAPDKSKYSGLLAYMQTANKDNWEIPVDDVVVGGVPCKLTGNTAIIDTGTSQMFLPPLQAKVLFSKIPGSQQADTETWHVPCDTTTSIEMVFAKVPFSISPADYVGNPVAGGNMCSCTIFGVKIQTDTQWLLGDVFLKNVYSVFDSDKARIGKKASSRPSVPPILTCFQAWRAKLSKPRHRQRQQQRQLPLAQQRPPSQQ
jgi:cathepsin D